MGQGGKGWGLERLEAIARPKSLPTGVKGEQEKDDKDSTEYGEYEDPHDKVNGSVRS